MIALAMCSITNAVILLMQDLLRLGSEAVLGLLRIIGSGGCLPENGKSVMRKTCSDD